MKLYPLTIISVISIMFIFSAGCKKPQNSTTYDFTYSSQNYFMGDEIQFQSFAPSGSTITWDFGDNSTGSQPTAKHRYLRAGTFTVTMIADHIHIVKKIINIGEYRIDIPTATPFNPGKVIAFTSTVAASGHSFLWNFGDGVTSTDISPSHIYTAGGMYTVTLMIDSLFWINKSITIEEYSIQIVTGLPYYPGKGISFKSTAPAGSTYYWNFGDSTTSTEAEPTHTYAHSGHFKVSLIVNNIPSRTIYDSLDVSLYPAKTSQVAGNKLWHHNYYGVFTNGTMLTPTVYPDTSFAVNYLNDFTISVGGTLLAYRRSIHDSTLHFESGDLQLDYNTFTGAVNYYKRTLYTGVGHGMWYYVDNFYTP